MRAQAFLFLLVFAFSVQSRAQDAAEADGRPDDNWGPRFGGGLLVDTATYAQDDESKLQMGLEPAVKLRDLRALLKGRFRFAPQLSYSVGYMYDGPNDVWRFRQTGLMLNIPSLSGNIFVGRTKEGFSTNKLMVGYHGWANERAVANDAFLPILADGIKWTGTAFGGGMVYNFGWFIGSLTDQPYVKNDHQFAARAVWLPWARDNTAPLMHLALQTRYGASRNGTLQFKSKPESFAAQSEAVDTGKFPASGSAMLGFEAYYRPSALVLGSEYFLNQVSSPETGDPLFHGGEIFAAYTLTGEVRPYKASGGHFEAISPERSVFDGGRGAWELVLRYSYADLDSGAIEGGVFQRITPMVNWHMSDSVRLEAAYGYSLLDREGLLGRTQYFQTRVQLTL